MWLAKEITTRQVTLDFSSSEQPNPTVTQLVVNGEVFANAVELISWGESTIQLFVCEECGIETCQPGGWVAPRRAGELIAFVPLFDDMQAEEDSISESSPPRFVTDRGVAVFTLDLYQSLQQVCSGLPDTDQLEALSGEELIRSIQIDAPWRVLGRFPEPVQLRRDVILAASDGDPREIAEALWRTVQELMKAPIVRLVPADVDAERIVLYLDGPSIPEWSAWMRGSEDNLLLSPIEGWVVDHACVMAGSVESP